MSTNDSAQTPHTSPTTATHDAPQGRDGTPATAAQQPEQQHPGAHETVEVRRTPRTGPIVWGCLILIFCAYVLQRTIAPETVSGTVWITGTLIGLGVLLLIVGVAIVARNGREK